jgi:hypothetical protein
MSKVINRLGDILQRYHNIIVISVFVIYLIIGLSVYRDYGISTDETAQMQLGIYNYDYIRGRSTDLFQAGNSYYGPVFQLILVIISKLLRVTALRDIYFLRHLITFVFFYIGAIFFYFLTKKIFNHWAISLTGVIFLIASPVIFSHSFYNSKDIPSLSAFTIAIFTMIFFLERPNLIRGLLHASACAFLIAIRIPGIIIPVLTAFFLGIDFLAKQNPIKQKKWRYGANFMAYSVALVGITILIYPILWTNPIGNFLNALHLMSRYPHKQATLYMGSFLHPAELPWHYIPVSMLITTPILYTILFFIGLMITSAFLIKKLPSLKIDADTRNDLIVLAWLFGPLVAVIVAKSILYDTWRQMFFIYPPFLLLSLKGLQYLWDRVRSVLSIYFWRSMLILVVTFSLGWTARFMIINHPYEHVYYNILAGPSMDVIRYRFELDYWGLSYRRALEYILANDKSENIKLMVANDVGKDNAILLPEADRNRLTFIYNINDAKYFLGNYRNNPEGYPYPNEYYSIKVGGTKIMVVYKLQ